MRLDREEMIRILEEIIRDPETNATARCTAIRTLREIPEPAGERRVPRALWGRVANDGTGSPPTNG